MAGPQGASILSGLELDRIGTRDLVRFHAGVYNEVMTEV